ncbi:MAG TPA: hypothetical protein VIY54_12645 [Steroidobacteraceae bacterium]
MPWYRFDLLVPLSPAEVLQQMRCLTRPAPGFRQALRESFQRAAADQPAFIGDVMENSFRIRRDIHYRNSFLPVIRGRIEPDPLGSLVHVRMSLHPLVALFTIFWLSMVLVCGARMLYSASSSRGMGVAVTAAMFVFGIGLTLGAFIPEAIKAKRLLVRTLCSSSAL